MILCSVPCWMSRGERLVPNVASITFTTSLQFFMCCLLNKIACSWRRYFVVFQQEIEIAKKLFSNLAMCSYYVLRNICEWCGCLDCLKCHFWAPTVHVDFKIFWLSMPELLREKGSHSPFLATAAYMYFTKPTIYQKTYWNPWEIYHTTQEWPNFISKLSVAITRPQPAAGLHGKGGRE